jgi:hypothetical protein
MWQAGSRRLRALLDVDWPIHAFGGAADVLPVARRLAAAPDAGRAALRERVGALRAATVASCRNWLAPRGPAPAAALGRLVPPMPLQSVEASDRFDEINRAIAAGFRYPDADTPDAKLGPPPRLLPQIKALTVYIRRGVHADASYLCLRQLVEGQLELALAQLDSRWLVSICDSYADHGTPMEARNALLISTFLTCEPLAATYRHWAEPGCATRRVAGLVAPGNEPLWDGLMTIQLERGDTVGNLLARYARPLADTPHLLAIWRTLLGRIRSHDSVLAALDAPHGHLLDENLDWLADPRFDNRIEPWRRRWLRERG